MSILLAGLYDLLQHDPAVLFRRDADLRAAQLVRVLGYNPAHQILVRLCEPLLAPVRRVIPPLGGLDLSALFVLIALQALQILLR